MVKASPDSKGGIYLLYGKEEFLKREFIQKLRQEYFSSGQHSEMGFQKFEALNHPLAALADFLSNDSFFVSQKMAVLFGLEDLDAEDRQKLIRFIENPPASSLLVLVSMESNIKKDAFLRSLSEKARGIACHPPFDKDLPGWVQTRTKKQGKTIDNEAVDLLIDRTGKDTAFLDSAIEQLALFTGRETRIQPSHVQALLGRSVQVDTFCLLDLLLEKKLRSALENLETLLREGARIYEIIGALSGQLDRLGKARRLIDEGFPYETIAAELRLHPFFARRILNQAERVPKDRYCRILKYLLECDEAAKTGKLTDRLALQRLFLKIYLSSQ